MKQTKDSFIAIVAVTEANMDGRDRDVPWNKLPIEPGNLESLLKNKTLIMSGDTREKIRQDLDWLDISENDQVVQTDNKKQEPEDAILMRNASSSLHFAFRDHVHHPLDAVLIGGAETYRHFRNQSNYRIDRLILLSLDGENAPEDFHADFPHLESNKGGAVTTFRR